MRLRRKLIYTVFVIGIYILGKNIPLPGVVRQTNILSAENNLMSMIELVLGSDSEQTSIFALDLAPWMTASIIVQLSSMAGGRNNARTSSIAIQRRTRWMALFFAVVNACIRSSSMELASGIFENAFLTRAMVILVMVTGAFVVLWLAEQNKEKGLGGVICIILVNILRNLVQIIGETLVDIRQGQYDSAQGLLVLGLIVLFAVGGMVAMVILENGEIHLAVQRVLIDSEMEKENYFAMKANPAGMQAMMYVMAFYLVPYYIICILQMIWPENAMISSVAGGFNLYHPLGLALYVFMYLLIAVSLAYVQISPSDIAQQMEEKGDCIVGVRPGHDTEICLKRIVLHYALISALILGSIMGAAMSLRVAFSLDSDIVMLPVLIMILSGIMQNILSEVRTMKVLDQYKPLLGENEIR
ncbi:MAG: hypothetical protein LUC95_05435 [Lachnospiraceae bacterium]|nr:hypothetical protein [Lachnospiraceae bacterium]